MEDNTHDLRSQFYHALCIITTMVLVSWCIYEYSLDRDFAGISLRKYHETEEDMYPSISICYKSPYIAQKYISYYNKNVNCTLNTKLKQKCILKAEEVLRHYSNLINGSELYFNTPALQEAIKNKELLESLEKIDYDDVTINLKDIISEFKISIPIHFDSLDQLSYDVVNESLVLNKTASWQSQSLTKFNYINPYISARRYNRKCFTFDVPVQHGIQIREIKIRLNPSIFLWGLDLSQIYTTLTYPKQFLWSSRGNQIDLPDQRRAQCYKFKIKMGHMEVFKRRDKRSKRCNADWKNHDEHQLNDILSNVGCNPKHWKIQSSLPTCHRIDQYAKLNEKLYKKDGYMPPCRSIEKLSKITEGTDLGWRGCCRGCSYLDLRFYFDGDILYKEIILDPAYSTQSLIGNAGRGFQKLFC